VSPEQHDHSSSTSTSSTSPTPPTGTAPRHRHTSLPSSLFFDLTSRKRKTISRRAPPTKFPRTSQWSPSPPPSAARSCNRFESMLDRPFKYWKQLDEVFAALFSDWNQFQRGRMIHHLIHFLELKIGLDEYIPQGLLLPSPLVDQAWRGLVLESLLYKKITRSIQDFHGKPHNKMIHYTIFSKSNDSDSKLRRTQSMFQVYFLETMPLTIFDEEQQEQSPQQPVIVFPTQQHIQQPILKDEKEMSLSFDDTDDDAASVTSHASTTLYGLGLLD
jgi:hypothetical protein